MRIAIFTEVFLPKIDGITNRLRHTLEWLTALGHEALVFAPDTAVAEHAGARVVRVPGAPFPPYPGLRITAPDPRIAWELRRFAPQVVHAVGPCCLGIWGIAAARALDLPAVASYHTDLPAYLPDYGLGWARPLLWPAIRGVHNAAHVNLCPSLHTRRELRERGIREVGLWRGGVDTRRFHPSRRSLPMRLRLAGERPDGPVLLYVGRLSREKCLDALVPVLDAHPEVHLALVGDGPERARLERLFAGRRVVFTGFLRGDDLAGAYASADLFVMPSTTETLGFVVLEAMSSGLAVVAANAGGVPDLVTHGANGLLVEPACPRAFADAVGDLLRHPSRRAFLAQQARKRALACDWQGETRRLVNEYRKAIVMHARRGLLGRIRHALLA